MPELFIVATPIGNLSDVSFRAIETLKKVDLILCEDTRVTQKLLNRYNIKTKTLSYHQHSKFKKINHIMELLEKGQSIALVSDAGTPGISDPGNKLIEEALKNVKDLTVVPIPGPSAITTALSVSGFGVDKFVFMGFPPAKKKRKKYFEKVMNSEYPVVFFESPHRILKTLGELKLLENRVVVLRELTKKFETVYRGTIADVEKELKKDKMRGEFVVIIEK